MQEPLLLSLVVLFVAILVLRFVRGVSVGRRLQASVSMGPCEDPDVARLVEQGKTSGKPGEAVRQLSSRANKAGTPALAAAHYSAAGSLALSELNRPGLAVGLYLRALRSDPTCVDALSQLQGILSAQKRLRRLEWTYWDTLGRMGEHDMGSDMWRRCWMGLASIYAASPRTVRRADAIRKSLSSLAPEFDDTEHETVDPHATVSS